MDAPGILKLAKTLGGFYKGKPTSPDSVKFTTDFQGIKIKVDRPKGFIMFGKDSKGADWRRKYKVDYGFIPKTLGGDDDGLDIFIGPNAKSKQAFWAVQRKEDGSFDEYKVFLGCDTREEAMEIYRDHIPKKYFGRMITTTVDMMKAMLGEAPEETIKKTAMWAGFFQETCKLADTTEYGEMMPELQQPMNLRRYQQARIPPLTSLRHPANRYLKADLINALIQGAVGVGS
jgi:hypothetical protein